MNLGLKIRNWMLACIAAGFLLGAAAAIVASVWVLSSYFGLGSQAAQVYYLVALIIFLLGIVGSFYDMRKISGIASEINDDLKREIELAIEQASKEHSFHMHERQKAAEKEEDRTSV